MQPSHPHPGPPAYPAGFPVANDPYAKVRSLGTTVFVLLVIRASMRAVTYGAFRLLAPSGALTEAQFDGLRTMDMVLLGVENLVALVAMILFLVWIHRLFTAVRSTGATTKTSPGMAVGGWFIPLANVVLPCLSVREALRSMGRSGGLAVVWWLLWLANMSLLGTHQLLRQLALVPELYDVLPGEILGPLQEQAASTFWIFFGTDTLAWGLLAVIVAMVRSAAQPGMLRR